MFKIFKFMKLNSYLEDCKIIKPIYHQINHSNLIKCLQFFNLENQSTRQNAKRLIQMLYEKNLTAVRIKILILIHYLITNYHGYADFFLQYSRKQFDGPTIVKKQQFTVNEIKNNRLTQSLTFVKKPIDQDINYMDVNVYLHLHLLLPYFSYLMKLCADIQFYQKCKTNTKNLTIEKVDFNLIWKIINTLKSILYIKDTLSHIGRYYFKISSYIISFIQAITYDFNIYYAILSNHMMKAVQLYQKLTKLEMESFLTLLQQIKDLNEMLYQIYLNRYFSKLLKNLTQPNWFDVSNNLSEKLISIYYNTYGINLNKKNQKSPQKKNKFERNQVRQSSINKFKTEEC